ncbi:hypothetical protein [Sorangium sp. So ce1099]|uniref:hypothetical protein n=1 Tax=Sorangium sp. So ce1099 TaxID=3133331 RepID=UPI003F640A58
MHVSRWASSALQALIITAALLPTRAIAAPTGPRAVDLRWQAPDGCPAGDEVRNEIVRLLGASEQRQPIEVDIAVAREGDARLRLALRIRRPAPGERVLHGDDCASMSRAAALIVAMSIDPDAVARNAAAQPQEADAAVARTPRPPPPAAGSPPATDRPPAAGRPPPADRPPAADRPPTADRPPAAERDVDGALWVSAHVEQALVPALGVGLAAGGAIRSGWFRADAAAGVVPSSSARIAGQAAGAEFRLWFLEVDTCARALRHPVVRVYLCALGRQHWLMATGRQVDEPFHRAAPIFAIGLGTLLEADIAAPLRLEGALHAVAPLQRPRFIVENLEGTVYRPPAAGVSARLGLALVF